ncbi:MAG: sulfite exporter TauE/SafE family protein [Pirellulaceae bacterium]
MIELPLVLMSGMLGSAHCLGMCGGFALAIGGGATSVRSNLHRQLAYTAGRVFTYIVLGAAAAFGGWRLTRAMPEIVNLPAILAIVAGVLLVYQGLAAAGWIRWPRITGAAPCAAAGTFRTFLTAPGLLNPMIAGMLTGFLPCGLLYAMLALAAASRDLWIGAALMGVFGLGTAPAMLLAGAGGSLLSLAGRRRLLVLAAWCVVVTGLVSIARGCGFVTLPGIVESGGCPLCQ